MSALSSQRIFFQIAALLCIVSVATQSYSAPRGRGEQGDISACTAISQPGSYTVSVDLPGIGGLLVDGSCIAIQASGVSIDLANHVITGPGIASGFGITDGGVSYSNISVFDGTITGFATAIDLGASSASIIRNVRVSDNASDGIVVGIESFLLQNIAVRNTRGIVYACPSNAIANSAWGNSSEDLLEIDPIFCTLTEGHNSYGSTGGSNQACELLGFSDCNGTCTATDVDPRNCGACGFSCQPGEVCSSGTCVLTCESGKTECYGSCVDLLSDENNCGSCGSACGSGDLCVSAACTVSCQVGLQNCNGLCTNIDTDESNCGACGSQCASGEFCSAGVCTAP